MKMKVGMNLFLWTGDPTQERLLPLYDRLKAMGFDGVELPIVGDLADLVPERFALLGRRLDDLGLARTACSALAPGEHLPSVDPAQRAAGVAKLERAIECASAAGASLVVGPLYAGLGVMTGAGPTGDEWRRSVEGVRRASEHGGRCGVTLALEYLNRFETYVLNCAVDAARFARDVDHPRCRIMYDTFHAHIEEKNIATAVDAAAPLLAHVHISENDRSTPGRGQVDWARTFAALAAIRYDGWLTIEAFGQTVPALAAATRIWRRMFEDEEQLARAGHDFIRGQLAIRSRPA